MARRRDRVPVLGEGARVRAYLIAFLEELTELYGGMAGCPWPAQLAGLRRGASMEVAGWEIAEVLPVSSNDRVRLESDDSLTLLTA